MIPVGNFPTESRTTEIGLKIYTWLYMGLTFKGPEFALCDSLAEPDQGHKTLVGHIDLVEQFQHLGQLIFAHFNVEQCSGDIGQMIDYVDGFTKIGHLFSDRFASVNLVDFLEIGKNGRRWCALVTGVVEEARVGGGQVW